MPSPAEIALESRSRVAQAISRLAGLTYAQRKRQERLAEMEQQKNLRTSYLSEMENTGGAYQGAAGGMAAGAGVGSLFGPWGAGLGALGGGLVGLFAGHKGESNREKEIKKRYKAMGLENLAGAEQGWSAPNPEEALGLLGAAGSTAGMIGQGIAKTKAAADAKEMRGLQMAALKQMAGLGGTTAGSSGMLKNFAATAPSPYDNPSAIPSPMTVGFTDPAEHTLFGNAAPDARVAAFLQSMQQPQNTVINATPVGGSSFGVPAGVQNKWQQEAAQRALIENVARFLANPNMMMP